MLVEAVVQAVGVGRVHVRALSPPMLLPVNNSQTERYTRIVFWRNAFGGAHEARWAALADELAAHFAAHTGRALASQHLEYLRCKLPAGGDEYESPASAPVGKPILYKYCFVLVSCTVYCTVLN